MKGLALDVVWSIVIAMASVLLFLGIVTGTLKNAANWIYCDIFMKIINLFSGSETASVPESCKDIVGSEAIIVKVLDTDNEIFSRKLLSYIIVCWKEAEVKGLYESHPCYDLRLSGAVDDVSEKNVSDILIKEDRCISIENSDYGCGEQDQILWSVDGMIKHLTRQNISDALNEFIYPKKIVFIEDKIPQIDDVKTKSKLKTFLSKDVPESICKSLKTKCSWKFIKSTNDILFNINEDGKTKQYSYNVDQILFYIEKNGFVDSFINNQKILLVKYNGVRDAVEVIG